jgi:hypothetical protein
MINLRHFEIVIHGNFGIVFGHMVSVEGRLGVLDGGVNAKAKGPKTHDRTGAGIGFQIELDE